MIDPTASPANKVRAYLRKYGMGIEELGMTPTTLRGW